MWYEMFFYLCIALVIFVLISLSIWKWKAFFVILMVIAVAVGSYWWPTVSSQWRFSDVHRKERWKIVYSHDPGSGPLMELRFLGADTVVLREQDHSFRNPSLSKDGRRIAFSISEGPNPGAENKGMGVVGSDGRGFQRLLSSPSQCEGVSWSPDGKKIAFWTNRNPETQSMDLCLFDVKTGKTRVLLGKATFYGTSFTLSWSPDSLRLAFASLDGYVSIVAIDTLKVTPVVKGDAPSWSPDGTRIIYREGIPYSRNPEDRVKYYTISPGGKQRTFVFDGGPEKWDSGLVTQPVVWSPDSRYILFFKTYDPFLNTNFSKIYLVDTLKNRKYLVKRQKHIQACSWGRLH